MQQMLPIKVGSYRVFNQVRESLSMEIHFHCYLAVDAPTHLSIHIRKTDSVCFFIVSEFAMFEGQGGHSCSFGILVVFAAFNVCHIQAAISVYFSFFCNNLFSCSTFCVKLWPQKRWLCKFLDTYHVCTIVAND